MLNRLHLKYWIILTGCFLFSLTLPGQIQPEKPQPTHANWKGIHSSAEVLENFPHKINFLIDVLNLNHPGLETAKQAIKNQDTVEALNHIVTYYRNVKNADWLLESNNDFSRESRTEANNALNNIFTFQLVKDTVPLLDDGSLYWRHYGPRNDKEWCYFLNRHSFLDALVTGWQTTGNAKYARKYDQLIRDWVIHNPPPGKETHTATWRVLEVGLRMTNVWPSTFYTMVKSEAFSPAGILLMLSSIPRHADYLQKYHENFNNRAVMELNGLALGAMTFPEFKASDKWYDYAKKRMLKEIQKQVYPDGAQDELTCHYHAVALSHFWNFTRNSRDAGYQISREFLNMLESMGNYIAHTLRPDGSIPLNNDSDRDQRLPYVKNLADYFDRKDWRYIGTQGEKGEKPSPTSIVFPWAGQMASRDSWKPDSKWSFFDIGPWGTGHQHNDKLHLSVFAHGRDILVDAGRFAYTGEVAEKYRTPYAKHTRGHNAVLIDGNGQNPGPEKAKTPLDKKSYKITDQYDYAIGTMENFKIEEGNPTHKRAVMYVKPHFWVVVDQVKTKRPRSIETLWHYHPDCSVEKTEYGVTSIDQNKGNIRVFPIGENNWDIELVKGQENPYPQGWYSVQYNEFEPSTATIFRKDINQSEVFAWLLVPAKGKVPQYSAQILEKSDHYIRLSVNQPDGEQFEIKVPLKGGEPELDASP